jgi:hypothetical protein
VAFAIDSGEKGTVHVKLGREALDAATKAKTITVRGFSFDARGLPKYFNVGLALAKR